MADPDYRYCVGRVARSLATGAQTVTGIADALGAFTPKAVLVWGTVQAGDGYVGEGWSFMGVSDGVHSYAAGMWSNTGQVAPSINWSNLITAIGFIVIPQRTTQTTTGYAAGTAVTFGAGSFSFTWSASADTTPFDLHYLAIGGADLACEVGVALDPTTPGPLTISSALGQITGLITMPVPGTGFQVYAIPVFVTGSWPGMGLVDQALNQGVLATSTGPADFTASRGYQYETPGVATAKLGQIGTTVATQAAATALGVGSVSLTYTVTDSPTAWTPGAGFFYLAIQGPRVVVGALNSPTSAGVTTIPGLPFQAGAVLALTDGLPASGAVQPSVGWSIGVATPLAQANNWSGNLQGVPTSSTSRGQFADRTITMAAATVGEGQQVNAVASMALVDGDPPTLTWSVANGTARRWLYMALEGKPIPIPPPPPEPQQGCVVANTFGNVIS